MDMTSERWTYTTAYLREVFGRQDQQLSTLMTRAVAAGLPDIAVSADVGRLLKILASMTNGGQGARLIIELGTLAGYSGIWLSRGLCQKPPGRLLTVEPVGKHADFAQKEFHAAGLADRVTIVRQPGLAALDRLARELGPGCADVVFIDAIKTEYPEYFRLARPLIARSGLLIADNILGSGSWWIDTPPGTSPDRDAADRFSRTVAADPEFEAVGIPMREGVLVARRR
jgi:predicted O-methyltransferase YrrM